MGINQPVFAKRLNELKQVSTDAAEAAINAGFEMNPRQAQAFRAVHAGLMSGMKLDPTIMRQANEMFGHVVQTLKAEDFLKADGVTGTPSSTEMDQANSRRDFLLSIRKDPRLTTGGSDILATFVALAQVDDGLRTVLQEMKTPKINRVKWDSVDSFLEGLGTTAVNVLTTLSLTRDRQNPNVTVQLDLLSASLMEVKTQSSFLAQLQVLEKPIGWANDKVAGAIKVGSEKATEWVRAQADKSSTVRVKQLGAVAAGITALGSKELSAERGEALTRMLNQTKGWSEVRALVNDFRGMTLTNATILRMINKVRASVDAIRQDAREGVPQDLAEKFSRKLSKHEWSRLHMGIARADLLSLDLAGSLALMKDPSSAKGLIQETEEQLAAMGGAYANRYKAKAKALAIYMVKRENTSEHLLMNAHAIAHLLGEEGQDKAQIDALATDDLVAAIGRLTSLYAYQELDQATKDTMKDLMATEPTGMETLAGFLRWVRQVEFERRDAQGLAGDVAANNGWKGYVPSTPQEGSSVIVRDDADSDELIRTGFTRVGDYKGDTREGYQGKRGYYQSSVSGRNAFRQGVAQTVHDTYQGVNARTGETIGKEMGGVLRGTKVKRLAQISNARRGKNEGKRAGEYLIPVFGAKGNVVGYERPLAHFLP